MPTITTTGIAPGSIGTTQLASGSVGTAQLAVGAVTQLAHAYGVTSSPTTTSTTYVDMPDMAVTLTTTGGDLLVWGHADVSNSAAGDGVGVAISLDGAAPVGNSVPISATANQVCPTVCLAHFAGVAAGGHTVKLQWVLLFGGTATATATQRQLVAMEVRR